MIKANIITCISNILDVVNNINNNKHDYCNTCLTVDKIQVDRMDAISSQVDWVEHRPILSNPRKEEKRQK